MKAARPSPAYAALVPTLIWGTAILLVVAYFTPLFVIERFGIFRETVSIYSGLRVLWADGEALLFGAIFVFSIVVPMAKVFVLAALWYVPATAGSIGGPGVVRIIDELGRWSMLDVLLVALLLVVLRLDLMLDVSVRPGIYLFATAVLCNMLLGRAMLHMTDRQYTEEQQ